MKKTMEMYLKGSLWFIASLFISSTNDIVSKYLSGSINSWTIVFFRFFFGSIFLLPFILCSGYQSIKTSRPLLHILRGMLLFSGISLWVLSLNVSHVVVATIFSFTIPIFILILSPVFLRETVTYRSWIAVIVGMLGILITLNPSTRDFDMQSLAFIVSAIIFATLDIINKRYIVKETTISMLFYSSLAAMTFAFFPTILSWKLPAMHDLIILALLGFSSNAILFCLLKSFSLVNVSSVSIFRYLELIFSFGLSYLIFQTLPGKNVYLGALIIIVCSWYTIKNQVQDKC